MIEIVVHPSDPIAPADMAWYATEADYDDTSPVAWGRTKIDALNEVIELTREGFFS